LCENIESFDVRYFDPVTGTWIETWNSTLVTGQANRIPLEVRVTIVLKNVPSGVQSTYVTKFQLPMQQPLQFGIPR
jgi:general secretion pathway protein J